MLVLIHRLQAALEVAVVAFPQFVVPYSSRVRLHAASAPPQLQIRRQLKLGILQLAALTFLPSDEPHRPDPTLCAAAAPPLLPIRRQATARAGNRRF